MDSSATASPPFYSSEDSDSSWPRGRGEDGDSPLARPLPGHDTDSDEGMAPLGLEDGVDDARNRGGRTAQPPFTLAHRLAQEVQAAAAAGGGGGGYRAHSPQLDHLRQLQLRPGAVEAAVEAAVDLSPGGGERPPVGYKCRACPARFSHLNLVSKHVQETHPVERPYLCPGPDCGRRYILKEVMEAHNSMVHCGERPYPCDQCHKVFSRRTYLQQHGRVHSGYKPYRCLDCGRCFAWKGSIDVHVRTHTGERPYLCLTCAKDFATRSALKMHEMIHTFSFPFPCDRARCGRRFRRSYDLRTHVDLCHRADELQGDLPDDPWGDLADRPRDNLEGDLADRPRDNLEGDLADRPRDNLEGDLADRPRDNLEGDLADRPRDSLEGDLVDRLLQQQQLVPWGGAAVTQQ